MSVEHDLRKHQNEQDRNDALAEAYVEQAKAELAEEILEEGHLFLITDNDNIPIRNASILFPILWSNITRWLESEGSDLVTERIHDIDQRERERMQKPSNKEQD